MRTWLYWGIVVAITVFCLAVVSGFEPNYQLIEGVIIFSIIPSIPLYFYRRRNERLISSSLEKRDMTRYSEIDMHKISNSWFRDI